MDQTSVTSTFPKSTSSFLPTMTDPQLKSLSTPLPGTSPLTPGVQAVVDQYLSKLEEGMKEVIGELNCELEGKFSELRTKETNLGNLITDIIRRATRTDVALLNSGTMRLDTIHGVGEFKMKVC